MEIFLKFMIISDSYRILKITFILSLKDPLKPIRIAHVYKKLHNLKESLELP